MSSIPLINKPKSKRYFTQDTENAIVKYNNTEDALEKSRIYEQEIHYAFFKLTENIIHTFKFYYTEVDNLEDLQHEIIIFLLSKIQLFDPVKSINERIGKILDKENFTGFIDFLEGRKIINQSDIIKYSETLDLDSKKRDEIKLLFPPKAYSYFGTITKRWLIIYNDKNYKKKVDKIPMEDLEQEESHSTSLELDIESKLPLSYKEKLSNFTDLYIDYCTNNLEILFPDKEDAKIADAILELFRKRGNLDIFNKKALYIYIREMVDVKTPRITKTADVLGAIFKKSYIYYLEYNIIKF